MLWKKLFVFPVLFLAAVLSAAEFPTIAGHWEGKITLRPGFELGVLIDFQQENGVWKGDIDIPVQAAKDLPLTNITVNGAEAEFEIVGPPGKPTFKGTLSADGNTLSGNFIQSGQTFPFTLGRGTAAKPDVKAKTESEILDDIRQRVKTTMPDWHTPGLALALIKDGKVILAEGFGVKETKTNQSVTANTLFAIGSSTKAFTATMMGVAVDEGKIKWEEPVKTYIPAFKLHDGFASDRMTAKDLLTHRSGLPRHDVVWYGSPLSRKELFERLKYLEPTKDFRTVFQYQNLMFMTAGYLEEQVEGRSWETLVKEKILDPVGMGNTNFSVSDSQKTSDFALPYEYKEEEKKPALLKEMPFRNIDAVGPAGSINSNIMDMSKWVLLNLNGGAVNGKAVVSKSALDEIQGPQMVIRGGIFSELLAFPEMPYLMYGMGWFIQPYRGHRMIHHGGNIDGFSAMVSFMPDDKLGLVILTNLDGNLLVDSLMLEIYDRLLGMEPIDWNARYKLKWAQIKEAAKLSNQKEQDVLRKPGTKPSHLLQEFAGDFEESAYGRLSIELSGATLKATLHGISSLLEHFHYDIFRATEDPLKGTRLSFLTNFRGDIDRVSVPLEAGVPEIVFKRIPPASMRDPRFLQQFAGEYELLGLAVTVQLHEDHLTLTVPGQPTYTLEPYLGTEFSLKDQEGFSVKFTVVKDQVTEAVFIQPNGVFTATRKK